MLALAALCFCHALSKRETNGSKPDPEPENHDSKNDISPKTISCLSAISTSLFEMKTTRGQVSLRRVCHTPGNSAAHTLLWVVKY